MGWWVQSTNMKKTHSITWRCTTSLIEPSLHTCARTTSLTEPQLHTVHANSTPQRTVGRSHRNLLPLGRILRAQLLILLCDRLRPHRPLQPLGRLSLFGRRPFWERAELPKKDRSVARGFGWHRLVSCPAGIGALSPPASPLSGWDLCAAHLSAFGQSLKIHFGWKASVPTETAGELRLETHKVLRDEGQGRGWATRGLAVSGSEYACCMHRQDRGLAVSGSEYAYCMHSQDRGLAVSGSEYAYCMHRQDGFRWRSKAMTADLLGRFVRARGGHQQDKSAEHDADAQYEHGPRKP